MRRNYPGDADMGMLSKNKCVRFRILTYHFVSLQLPHSLFVSVHLLSILYQLFTFHHYGSVVPSFLVFCLLFLLVCFLSVAFHFDSNYLPYSPFSVNFSFDHSSYLYFFSVLFYCGHSSLFRLHISYILCS